MVPACLRSSIFATIRAVSAVALLPLPWSLWDTLSPLRTPKDYPNTTSRLFCTSSRESANAPEGIDWLIRKRLDFQLDQNSHLEGSDRIKRHKKVADRAFHASRQDSEPILCRHESCNCRILGQLYWGRADTRLYKEYRTQQNSWLSGYNVPCSHKAGSSTEISYTETSGEYRTRTRTSQDIDYYVLAPSTNTQVAQTRFSTPDLFEYLTYE